MLIYYGVCVAVLGLIFGSFLNCTAMRIVRGEDFVKGRSHCMSCGHELTAADLIPLFSWLIHRGRCRHCGDKVSARYPITESVFMVLSLIMYIAIVIFGAGIGTYGGAENTLADAEFIYGTGITIVRVETFIKFWFLSGCLYVLSLTDLESFEIPDGTLVTALISWIAFSILELIFQIHDIKWILHHLAAGIIIGAVMLLMSLIMDKILKKDSMGGGDIKLYALLGLYLGYAGSYELIILSCVLGLIFAGIRKGVMPKASREFPFGPSIAAAGYILLMTGPAITEWYLGMFL